MSLVSVYDALKAAGVDDAKAVAAVRDLEEGQRDPALESRLDRMEDRLDRMDARLDRLEKRIIRLEVVTGIILALQVGQILLILRLLAG